MAMVFLMLATLLFFKIGYDKYQSDNFQNEEVVRLASSEFIKLHPHVSSVEYWKLNPIDNHWYCALSSGVFNLCNLTRKYLNDEWTKKTSIQIKANGFNIKSLDGKAEFLKYVELIGEDYHFVKFDTSSGVRVTFVSKPPLMDKEMKQFVERYSEYINLL
jgi:hypothetical protein